MGKSNVPLSEDHVPNVFLTLCYILLQVDVVSSLTIALNITGVNFLTKMTMITMMMTKKFSRK